MTILDPVYQFLGVLNSESHGKRLCLKRHPPSFQKFKGVTGAMTGGKNQPVAVDLFTPIDRKGGNLAVNY